MASLLKNLAFALALAVLVWLGYIVFVQEDQSVLTSEAANEAAIESAQFIAKLDDLKEIHLEDNSGVLRDPRFLSLVDNRQPILEKPYGRKNPFVPLIFKSTKK